MKHPTASDATFADLAVWYESKGREHDEPWATAFARVGLACRQQAAMEALRKMPEAEYVVAVLKLRAVANHEESRKATASPDLHQKCGQRADVQRKPVDLLTARLASNASQTHDRRAHAMTEEDAKLILELLRERAARDLVEAVLRDPNDTTPLDVADVARAAFLEAQPTTPDPEDEDDRGTP